VEIRRHHYRPTRRIVPFMAPQYSGTHVGNWDNQFGFFGITMLHAWSDVL
jgi:hypothetical protein